MVKKKFLLWFKVDQGGAKSGQYPHPIYMTSVWVHSVQYLYVNMAITTTKGFAVDRNLAWRELPFDIDPLVLHLYWHENNDNESSSKWMRDLMLKTYGKLQQVS